MPVGGDSQPRSTPKLTRKVHEFTNLCLMPYCKQQLGLALGGGFFLGELAFDSADDGRCECFDLWAARPALRGSLSAKRARHH
jgi:hypothetical protein